MHRSFPFFGGPGISATALLPVALAAGLLLGTWAPRQAAAASPPAEGPTLLSATVVPAVEEAGGTQLAVRWHGEPGARLRVTLEGLDGPARVLARDHALEPGVNLLPLLIDAGTPGSLHLQAHDAAGFLLATRKEPLSTSSLSGFTWKSTFFGRGLGLEDVGSRTQALSTAVVWDDGTGPALYIGGRFRTAAHLIVDGIARWDGSQWSPLGPGVRHGAEPGRVNALIVYQGDLVAAGLFTHAGEVAVNHIARWDGRQWSPLNGPVEPGTSGEVNALVIHQGDLLAGGYFTHAGGVAVNLLARWNGAEWSPAAGPTPIGIAPKALAVYDGDLVIGGHGGQLDGVSLNSIARWTGEAWAPLGTGVERFPDEPGFVESLAVFRGELIAGGYFWSAGGVGVNNVAAWDGERWSGLSGGFSSLFGVLDLLPLDGHLIAATEEPPFVVAWDGAAWAGLWGLNDGAAGLAIFEGELVAVGWFDTAGGLPAEGIATWDGATWAPATLDERVPDRTLSLPWGAAVNAAIELDGNLIVGGRFTAAGGATVNHVAGWDGVRWFPLPGPSGVGVGHQGSGVVNALAVYSGDLVVAGFFEEAGGVIANGIARWDGSEWLPLSGPHGTGVSGQVSSLVEYEGHLVVGGSFSEAGGLTVNHIARWDGEQWSAFPGPAGTGLDLPVLALSVHDGDLVAAGGFTEAGGVPVDSIARWDGGQWHPYTAPGGTGMLWVSVLAIFDGKLVAGGRLPGPGPIRTLLAVWDGSEWMSIGEVSGPVRALAPFADGLVVAGRFGRAGGVLVNNIARWDGGQWSALSGPSGVGTNGEVRALTIYDGNLVAGGAFTMTGGVANRRIGLYGPPCGSSSRSLCLDQQSGDQRFELTLDFETAQAGGLEGNARAVPLAPLGVTSGGLFHFGDPTNPEMLVKVLDGCTINGHHWLFHTAATNVGFHLLARDNLTGRLLVDGNPDLSPAQPYQNIEAFPCPPGAAGSNDSSAAAGPLWTALTSSPSPVSRSPWAASRSGHGCPGGEHVLCIAERFQVEVDFETSQAGGLSGKAPAIPLAAVGVDRGGLFHFGNPTNPEVLLKVLDGCALNDHYWVFFSAATNVGLDVRVTDTLTGEEGTYENPDLTPATPVQDTAALPCE